MDGDILMGIPFVVQTTTIATNVHRHHYRMKAGYKVRENGIITENYWERIGKRQQQHEDGGSRKPYGIELVRESCDMRFLDNAT